MKVSVVVNTYATDRFDDFRAAVEAVLAQTYDPIEVVLVVDGNDELCSKVTTTYGDREDVVIHCTEENVGNSAARTAGGKVATGDIIAVTDDDAVPEPDWIAELVRVYEETDALAVGGKVIPEWVDHTPGFLPEEFYWLIGCNHRGFGEHMQELRNTFGPNISFRADVFEALGGFSAEVGRVGDKQLQAHETDIGARLQREYGRGVVYTEDAVVRHKIYAYRLQWAWLLNRSFWQGYSKRVFQTKVKNAMGRETAFLQQLAFSFVPQRILALIGSPSAEELKQLGAIILFTALVGIGYLYGTARLFIENTIRA